ncbi:uncharacterized protein LOC131075829 isoform X1 [Cryptomeria japonica]|uniref:uncharacterized protein LOC131075829 isoform X1 n=1 Tax=Cryptomeria japonica TaxID=3369 RepID=UPI0027DA0AB9|nr:uncharacterized protein LOC131075829 isoform X1 [Cryptomeria japonica]XP_057868713.2 uncharacterized protein LOC131075829 isoform X1 [Cryptomeria japonica]
MEGGLCSACVVSPHGNFSVNPFDMPLDHVSAKGHISSSTRGPMCYVSGHDMLDPLLSLSSCTDSFEYGEKRTESGMTQSSGSIEKAVQQDEYFISDAPLPGKSCSNSAIINKRSRELVLQQNNYVYKRKKLRHSLTLLSGRAHAAFTKETAQSIPSNSNQPTQEGKIEILLDTEVNPRAHRKISTAGPESLHPDENLVISESDVNDKLDAKKPVSEYQISNLEKAVNMLEKEEICMQHNKTDISTMEISNHLLQPGKTTLNSGSTQVLNENCNGNRSRDILPHEETDSMSQSESSSFLYDFERKVGRQESCAEATCNSRSDSGSFTTLSYPIMNNHQDKLSEAGEFGYCIPDAAKVAEGRDLEREWCISILNESKLRSVSPGKFAATEHPGVVGDGRWNKRCKVCYTLENSTSTLICDMCEESFHMACCNPKVVSIPVKDNWYCPACRKKRKRSVVREKSGLSWDENRENGHVLEFRSCDTVKSGCGKFVKEKNGRFWCMFQDNEAYTTQVRIGKDYQADVPVWTGKVMDSAESPFMGELVSSAENFLELELTEHNLKNDMWPKDWKPPKFPTPGSNENWLQCQNVLFREGDVFPDGRKAKKDIICGKWRRAPGTEVQSDEWDCSCAVVWDPLHADCAVPQELETEDIIERLKASKMACELHVDLSAWENDKHREN